MQHKQFQGHPADSSGAVQDEAQLGPRPGQWSDVIVTLERECHASFRAFTTGMHELRANQLAHARTKHVAPVLGALSITAQATKPQTETPTAETPSPATATPAAGNAGPDIVPGGHAVHNSAATSSAASNGADTAGADAAASAAASASGETGAIIDETAAASGEPKRAATHILLLHALGTPMDDFVLADSTLCIMVRFSQPACRCIITLSIRVCSVQNTNISGWIVGDVKHFQV